MGGGREGGREGGRLFDYFGEELDQPAEEEEEGLSAAVEEEGRKRLLIIEIIGRRDERERREGRGKRMDPTCRRSLKRCLPFKGEKF